MRPLWQFGSTCGTPHTDRPADTGREEIRNVDGLGGGDAVKDVVVVAFVVEVITVVVVEAVVVVDVVVVAVVGLLNRSVHMREF